MKMGTSYASAAFYMINWKRVLVFDVDSGAFKRGWGGCFNFVL